MNRTFMPSNPSHFYKWNVINTERKHRFFLCFITRCFIVAYKRILISLVVLMLYPIKVKSPYVVYIQTFMIIIGSPKQS